MIKNLGFGMLALPFLVNGHMPQIDISDLDPEERLLNVTEKEFVAMQDLIEECIDANKDSNSQMAVKEVMLRHFSEPNRILASLGEPNEAGIKVFYRSETLTIFAATWTPQMNLMPHNHYMWANIGIYTGREDNILWKRSKKGKITASGAECLFAGDVAHLDSNAIHSVTNPLERFTGGIHIYGGDFFATERSQWDPETLDEEPSNGDVIRAIFDRENEKMRNNK
jgi:predicted metal-dependent enzyme (double-stranded beta helix superfamily)